MSLRVIFVLAFSCPARVSISREPVLASLSLACCSEASLQAPTRLLSFVSLSRRVLQNKSLSFPQRYIYEKYTIEENNTNNSHINSAIQRGVDSNVLNLPKGASGKVKVTPTGKAQSNGNSDKEVSLVFSTWDEADDRDRTCRRRLPLVLKLLPKLPRRRRRL